MKIHTQDFKNELVNMGRQIDSIITYENTILHDELYGVSVHYEGNILKSVMKQLDIESSVSIPIGTTVNYQFGLKVGSSYTYLDYGNYIVYSAEKIEDANTYKIICYDKMLYTMKEYQDLNISYPITIRNYINAICVKLGITFNDSNTQFANYDKEIQQELYLDADGNSLGYTYRDVLDELAEATASIICINSSDKLEIRYPTNTNETINEDFLKDINVTFGEKYGAINTIVLSRSAGADNIYYPETLPEDIKAIKISDNQIMNWNDRDTYLPDIYNKLNGLEYYINDFSSIGIMFLEIGDFYNISIGSTTYKCLLLNDEINVTQGIEEIIHTDMPEEAETDYTKADKTDRRINQTYLIVDKQQGKIEALVSTTEEITGEMIPNLQAQIDGAIQFWNGANIPTLSNYPASDWTTEAQRNNHRADIYTVIQDVQGELKQGKSYRFDKIGNTWQWIELTDNELSAVQALANSKAKVFYTTPTVPYNLGDLWLRNGKLYKCKTAKDTNGSYSASDWEEAVDYTDDTVALLAQSAANAAQSTADGAVTAINNIKDTTGQAEGKIIYINDSNDDTLISAKFNGETNQDGEPSLNNPYEIENLEGKNKLNPADYLQGTFSPSTGGNNDVLEVNNIRVSTKLINISQLKNNIVYSGDYFDLIAFYDSSFQLINYTSNKSNAIPNNAKYCRLRFYNAGNELLVSTMKTTENQLEEGTVASPYVPYNSLEVKVTNEDETETQTVYFPLAEGQKLYEESYLANDGIHNKRRQLRLAIADMNNNEDYPGWTNQTQFAQDYPNININLGDLGVLFKSNITTNRYAVGANTNANNGILMLIKTVFNLTQTQWKTQYPDLVFQFEYDLPEEEIIPYNADQQKAWEQIEQLHTYKNITNIYSDAYAEIEYVRDNGLDIYETKASANVTKNDVAQLKIENGRISSEVSSTQSQLNNYYTKKEADNNTNSTKAELENIIQQNKTEIEQTTQAINLRVRSIETNGVDKIETSMGYTFDNDGLNIDKEGAATASTIDNEAFKVKNKSANENVFFAGYVSDQNSTYRGQTIVESTNLVVKNYLNIEGASRFQPYVNPVLGGHGTGAFDIG